MEAVAPSAPASPRARLRVGIFAGSRLQPRWIAEAVSLVAASGVADIVTLAEAGAGEAAAPALWRAYEWIDRRAFASGPDETAPVDLCAQLPGVPVLPLLDDSVPMDQLALWRESIAELRLDVAVALGDYEDVVLDGLARHGVWRFGFDDARGYAASQPGLNEVADARDTCASALVVRRAGGERRAAWRSWSRTFAFSVGRNRDEMLRKTSTFLVRALTELRRQGEGWLDTRDLLADTDSLQASGDARNVRSLARIGASVTRRAVQKALYVEQWFLGFAFGEASANPADLSGFVHLVPPKDRFWADPFPVVRGGRCFVFFEELIFANGKAHISVVEVDRQGHVSPARKVLERDCHLSYPFLVEDGGELYMIPETAEAGVVEAYRCTDFPLQWQRERVLLQDVRAVDATVFRHDSRWWMFANSARPGASFNDELNLYSSESLLEGWEAHGANPVKSDVRSARPAGRIQKRGGKLYRPAQVCAPLYGSALAIHRIDTLSTTEYAETLVETVAPQAKQGILGLHTINREGDFCVVDGFLRRPRLGRG